MIALLGSSGYIGQAFERELIRRKVAFRTFSRSDVDHTRFRALLTFLQEVKPDFLVNAAGYTGKPNVDACEVARADTLQGNTLFPDRLAHACLLTGTPWGHVSSGCIYSGAKIVENGKIRIEADLTRPDLKLLCSRRSEKVRGFTEEDEPNFSFGRSPCSFYSGTKALGEEAILQSGSSAYIWRLRIPFDEENNPRNYLTKLQTYPRVYDNFNSISHRTDFVKACLDLWERRAPFGVYNVINPGYVSAREVVDAIIKNKPQGRRFEFWENDEEFYRSAAKTPRSNCIMDSSKLQNVGISIRSVAEAIDASLRAGKSW